LKKKSNQFMSEPVLGNPILSKSTFLRGCQCPKSLWLYRHQSELRSPVSEGQKAIFDRGHRVGLLAQKLFPEGKEITLNRSDLQQSVSGTKELIEEGETVIYEAAFLQNEVFVAVDILVKDGYQWKIYEVKSSTGIHDVYLQDAAIQYQVLEDSGLSISDVSIVFLNNQYIRNGDLEIESLFTIESVLEPVIKKQSWVRQKVEELKGVLSQDLPEKDIGPHCSDPYDCEFMNHCWQHIPKNSVFDIAGLRGNKKFSLYDSGILNLEDVPEDFELTKSQRLQIRTHKSSETIIKKSKIRNFVEAIRYPIYFLDFETISLPVPLYDRSKPYQQVPFQYSIHYLEYQNATPRHWEFLAEAEPDPRPAFIEKIIQDILPDGDILVYNENFELTRLKELSRDFPQYEDELWQLRKRVKDLMIPFRKQWLYKPEMQGKYSIKKVLPALVADLTYESLNIQEGSSASIAFEGLMNERDVFKIDEVRIDLLKYCEMDTYAMVRIYKYLDNLNN